MSNEYKLKKSDFLVSQTDENGIITFANEDFCNISGYSLSELIGQPHSIIRHQDMPKCLFEEMWNTISKGKRWSGYIKNNIELFV